MENTKWFVGEIIDGNIRSKQQVTGTELALNIATNLSIEKDSFIYLSKCKKQKEEETIDYLVSGGTFYKEIEPIEILEKELRFIR